MTWRGRDKLEQRQGPQELVIKVLDRLADVRPSYLPPYLAEGVAKMSVAARR